MQFSINYILLFISGQEIIIVVKKDFKQVSDKLRRYYFGPLLGHLQEAFKDSGDHPVRGFICVGATDDIDVIFACTRGGEHRRGSGCSVSRNVERPGGTD